MPRTIARVKNPKNAWMFTPEMGVDVALNQADLLGHLIVEEISMEELRLPPECVPVAALLGPEGGK